MSWSTATMASSGSLWVRRTRAEVGSWVVSRSATAKASRRRCQELAPLSRGRRALRPRRVASRSGQCEAVRRLGPPTACTSTDDRSNPLAQAGKHAVPGHKWATATVIGRHLEAIRCHRRAQAKPLAPTEPHGLQAGGRMPHPCQIGEGPRAASRSLATRRGPRRALTVAQCRRQLADRSFELLARAKATGS